jgi:hypothetical protein
LAASTDRRASRLKTRRASKFAFGIILFSKPSIACGHRRCHGRLSSEN